MPIYNYTQIVKGEEINDNPFICECPYCKGRLIVTEIDDDWPIKEIEILKVHKRTAERYKEINDLEDY